jgi:hypothetical protein
MKRNAFKYSHAAPAAHHRQEKTMIAMSMLSTYDEYRRDRVARAPVYPAPAHPVRRALLHVLSMNGLGVGGVAAVDDETPD